MDICIFIKFEYFVYFLVIHLFLVSVRLLVSGVHWFGDQFGY
jgi:hypothetical protein